MFWNLSHVTFALGEAQRLSRLIESFSIAFAQSAASSKLTSDEIYIVVFACVMLNTDLHSPCIRTKMTKSQFLKNVGDQAPNMKREIETYYDSISAVPLKIQEHLDDF